MNSLLTAKKNKCRPKGCRPTQYSHLSDDHSIESVGGFDYWEPGILRGKTTKVAVCVLMRTRNCSYQMA